MESLAVELQKIFVVRGENVVLDGVSLRFAPGKTTVILGPSGCGKSTLLKIAAGIVLPDSGKVLIDGKNLHGMSERENLLYRRNNGFVFQDSALWANNSVYQNLSLPLRYHFPKMADEEIRARIERLVGRVGFRDNLDLRPDQTSAGERKIISFVRALVTEPGLLFMDEPLAEIDNQSADQMLGVLRELKREGRTIIMVTNDPGLTSQLADFLVVLKNGDVLESGPLAQVARSRKPEVIAILSRVLSEASTFDGSILDLLDGGQDT